MQKYYNFNKIFLLCKNIQLKKIYETNYIILYIV